MNALDHLSFSKQEHPVVGHFDAYHDGVLSEVETAAYRQHLAACKQCQRWVDVQQRIAQGLRYEASPPAIPSPAAAARIQRNLAGRMRKALIMNNIKAAVAATAVMAVLALIIGLFALHNSNLDTTEPIEEVAPESVIANGTKEPEIETEPIDDEQLVAAVEAGDSATVERLLEAGANPDARDASGDPILKSAIQARSPDLVALLVAHGADVNALDGSGNALLPEAVRRGDLTIVETLVDAGADLEAKLVAYATGFVVIDASALGWAASDGRNEIAEFLITRGADVNQISRAFDLVPLHLAAWADNADMIDLLLDNGANPYAQSNLSPEGLMPLHLAIVNGSLDAIRALLSGGVEVDVRLPSGQTPLMYALTVSALERARTVTILLEHGADPNLQNNAGNTALHQAARWNRLSSISTLIEYGASLDLQNNAGKTVLDVAVSPQVVELLRGLDAGQTNSEPGARATPQPESEAEQLAEAIAGRDAAATEQLLQAGADPNTGDASGDPLLRLAILDGSVDIVELLIEYGADVNALDSRGDALLPQAARSGQLEAVQLLLDAGADVHGRLTANDYDSGGVDGTALYHAALEGYDEIAELLIAHGADVNLGESWVNETPLHVAAFQNRPNMVAILLEHGADPDRLSDWRGGYTPLQYAAITGSVEAIEALLAGGANPNSQNEFGRTPLLSAIREIQAENLVETLAVLLEGGANPNLQDNSGDAALHHAALASRVEIVPLLIEYGADLDQRNNAGLTPLDLAVNDYFVELLLEAGATQ